MSGTKASLVIVDDECPVRSTLSHVLTEVGYRVRCAEDGFSALVEMRNEVPDILVSDLNMPNMTGFELLTVVRRRFPSVQAIAMSGAFNGDEVPSGVAADAFYQKGSSIGSLLRIMESLPPPDRISCRRPSPSAPVLIQRNGLDTSKMEAVSITCPECLRTSLLDCGDSINLILETNCKHCQSSIHYAVVHPSDPTSVHILPNCGRDLKSSVLSQRSEY